MLSKSILDITQCQHKRFQLCVGRGGTCVYVYMYQVCSYVGQKSTLGMFLYCFFWAHHFSLTGQPVSSGIHLPLYLLTPTQHGNYRCACTMPGFYMGAGDLTSSLHAYPSYIYSLNHHLSPPALLYTLSEWANMDTFSPCALMTFISLSNCTSEELIYFQTISEICGWVTWSVGKHAKSEGISWQVGRPNYQESPSLTMNKKKSWNSLPTQSYTLKKN